MRSLEELERKLDAAIEAVCSEFNLIDPNSKDVLRVHFEYIADKLADAVLFFRRHQLNITLEDDIEKWKRIKSYILSLYELTQREPLGDEAKLDEYRTITPNIAYTEMDELDHRIRHVYDDVIYNVRLLVVHLRLKTPPTNARGRPNNLDFELAVAHLVWVYRKFFGKEPDVRSERLEYSPFFRFCEAILLAMDAQCLVGSLPAKIKKVRHPIVVPLLDGQGE